MLYKSRVAFLSLIILFSTLTLFCGEEKAEEAPVIRPVRYMQVFSTGGSRERSFSGVAKAGQESRLSFKVPGTIKKMSVKVGDKVQAGNNIAELNTDDYQLQVQRAEAALDQAKAQQRNASANYERIRGLYENNNASKADLDGARTASESASAAVRSAERSLEIANLSLNYTNLTAPVNGTIAEVKAEENENVGAGQMIALLTSGSQIEVTVGVPEVLIARIKQGDKIKVTFDAVKGTEFSASVREIGVPSGKGTATFPITVRLNTASSSLRPGMAATAAFTFNYKDGRERMLVPPHSVGEDQTGRFVYTVEPKEDGLATVYKKAVTIGELTSDGLEILDGIVDGDLVVTAGVSKITDGLTVKFLGSEEK